jgi:hypothetical protein
LLVEESFLRFKGDPYHNRHLKTSKKEDEDFVILSDNVWNYLKGIYGGNDMPRFSIEAEKEDENEES